jgi:acyl carrier protein
MGLDTVELVITIEKTFGIDISDPEAEQLVTVGDTYRYILARLAEQGMNWTEGRCASHVAFNRFRSVLVGWLGVNRKAIRLATPLGDLLPIEQRRETRANLGQWLGVPLPSLGRPSSLLWLLTALVLATSIAAVVACGLAGFDWSGCFVLGVVLLFPLGMFASMITTPFATLVPLECGTVRTAVRYLILKDFNAIRHQPDICFGPEEVWKMLTTILVNDFGAAPDEITEDTHFVRDLGLD